MSWVERPLPERLRAAFYHPGTLLHRLAEGEILEVPIWDEPPPFLASDCDAKPDDIAPVTIERWRWIRVDRRTVIQRFEQPKEAACPPTR